MTMEGPKIDPTNKAYLNAVTVRPRMTFESNVTLFTSSVNSFPSNNAGWVATPGGTFWNHCYQFVPLGGA